jgi:3-methylcrotonyl-CoA carboxylase alpha subunit
MPFNLRFAGTAHELDIVAREPALLVRLDGRVHAVADGGIHNGRRTILVDGQAVTYVAVQDQNTMHLHLDGRALRVEIPDPRDAAAGGAGGADDIVAPMPGTVVSILRRPGDAVAAGDIVLTIESMKLQMNLAAPRAGIVARIAVQPNATFNKGETLVTFAAESGE